MKVSVTGWLLADPDGEESLHPDEQSAKGAAENRWTAQHWPRNQVTDLGGGRTQVTLAYIPPPELYWHPSDDAAGVEVLFANGKATGFRVRKIRYRVREVSEADA